MRIVCIYPGRFNPFHSSHYAVYKYLTSKFGSKNVYIVTSDIVKDKSPFTFKEKAFIMNKMFKIPYSNILQKNEPYKAEKLTSEFDPNNTVLVYVSTEKDPGRTVGRYFKGQLPKNPKPYKQQAYIINIPLIHNTIQGQEVSGTTIRNLFSSKNLSIQQKKKIFKQIFGKYDQSVFKLMINKLSNQKESLLRQKVQNVKFLDKTLNHILSGRFPITNKQFSQLNKNKITYSFHYCDVNGFKKLLAIQGTAKVISTTSANDIVMFRWGMWSEGGICCFLRGNFLVGDTVDLGTSPDETGRRWISRITAVFNSDLIAQKWYNYVRYLKNVWNKYSEKEQNDPKIKYEFIKRFFNHHSSFIEKYKKYYIPWNINKPPMASYDQVLLNRIKIISICALQKNKKLLAPYQNKFPITYVGHNEQSQFTKWYNSCRSLIKQETFNTKNNRILLTCGGASGHTLHIFQDTQLTFNDLKIIINNLLSGKINLESEASIKYDGQNINVSWKNGKLVGARNKGHFKNFGQTALDIMGMKKMFQGRGAIQEAFVYAMIDLQRAFSNLSKKELDQIFGNGRKWLSLEIIYPKTANVIPYDRSMLIFHNVTEVNENGNIVKIDNSMAKSLYSILTSVNANVQKHFSINPPTIVNLPQITNFSERKKYYLSKLNVLQQK